MRENFFCTGVCPEPLLLCHAVHVCVCLALKSQIRDMADKHRSSYSRQQFTKKTKLKKDSNYCLP
jgi:hypothetical protein